MASKSAWTGKGAAWIMQKWSVAGGLFYTAIIKNQRQHEFREFMLPRCERDSDLSKERLQPPSVTNL
ncbi:MAG: hypothetical protein MST10_00305 [Lentisphaeria bacterium]|nr:hypothetical protein [Lentisphaeria bacterium]